MLGGESPLLFEISGRPVRWLTAMYLILLGMRPQQFLQGCPPKEKNHLHPVLHCPNVMYGGTIVAMVNRGATATIFYFYGGVAKRKRK